MPALSATSRPVLTVALCCAVALLEGFDLQSTGITAPALAKAFGLAPAALGWVFSAGLMGLLPGAFLGGWLADRLGRKRTLLGAVLLFGLFTLYTAHAASYPSLLLARLLTGLGLGAALPIIIAQASEAVSPRFRSTAVSFTYCGVPLGGALASLISLSGLGEQWRVVFYLGGLAPLLIAAALALWMPAPVARPVTTRQSRGAVAVGLFSEGRARRTLLLWVACFFTLTVLYLLLNWLPSLLLAKGFDRVQAGWVQVLFNVGGAAGSLLTGRLMDRGRTVLAVAIAYLGMLLALAALGLAASFGAMALAGLVAGYCCIGGQLVLYALAPQAYPASMRATGVGACVAVGRLGSMAGPLAAGQILAAGAGVGGVLIAVSPGLVIAAIALLSMLGEGGGEPSSQKIVNNINH
ncbi:putative 3-hydroxyphenylpropionic transporter MhpT [Pseudomonas sp. M47T1]|uniref:3-(3-hydroxy-phenyl)propionate transporter MhpT n=1 Tax=Pseudomonas sp. M47T1 TaxID=1179778 RepID=UPI0002608028|nr:putative 3-hydroxyphenylpropionic transporter MhpT [Pseudomonas sp. M47T1]